MVMGKHVDVNTKTGEVTITDRDFPVQPAIVETRSIDLNKLAAKLVEKGIITNLEELK